MTDAIGNVLNRYEYDAFGNFTVKEETVTNRFCFTGEQYDPASNLYYLRARFYSPVIGRFLNEDTYYGDGLNLYAYCHNNPLTYVDPTGHWCEKKQQETVQKYKDKGYSDQDAETMANYERLREEQGVDAAEKYLQEQVRGSESGSGSSFTGKLRGEDVTLNNVNVHDITLKKRSSSELSQLRSEFNTSVRKNFLMDMGKQTEYLRSAGFTEADILKIQNGYVPTGWQVHHKIPLDGGGTNDFSNMVLIQNEPYHKVLTNYQNSVMKDMNEGDIIVVAWPQPNGNIYPITH